MTNCGDCKYFEPEASAHDKAWGSCCRYPPQNIQTDPEINQYETQFPWVEVKWWCGEGEEKEDEEFS